ncbi:hypothetical protein FHG87_025792, partial [Trinorchestia longiramus]
FEQLCNEVNRELHERILGMKAKSVQKCELGSSFQDIDGLIRLGVSWEMESSFYKKMRCSPRGTFAGSEPHIIYII